VTSAQKNLDKMRSNPLDWKIEQLETIAKQFEIKVRKSGGSHVVFSHPNWIDLLCVPARRPIKPIYIKKLVSLIDSLGGK
jgi:predicted RNA binding protein YcfA (HicA-like mRNA interferase family)